MKRASAGSRSIADPLDARNTPKETPAVTILDRNAI
jgi:hypothetical protein